MSKREESKMDDKKEITKRWIQDEQKVHDTADYGENLKSVQDALQEQQRRTDLVTDYKSELQAINKNQAKEDSEKLSEAYNSLILTSQKRLNCLTNISEIASLENNFGALSVELSSQATKLVNCQLEVKDSQSTEDQLKSSIGAQNCILAVRKNWSWISKLMRCTEIHLQFVKEYHQFFHEVHEYNNWMPIDLEKVQQKVSYNLIEKGTRQEAGKLLLDLKEVLALFMHWQGKLNAIFSRSKAVLPIHLRTKTIDYLRPITAICDYYTKEINIREKEDLILVNNSEPQSWVVRNMHNTEAIIPSVVCLIPGPDTKAVESAVRLQLQLLGVWTTNVKRIGKTIIAFLLMVLNNFNEEQVKSLNAMEEDDKAGLIGTLTNIIELFVPTWCNYEGFKTLLQHVNALDEELGKPGNPDDKNETFNQETTDKFTTVNELLLAFKNYWTNWQTYKVLTETSRHNDLVLLINKWQDLQYVDKDKLMRHWNSSLEFNEGDQSEWDALLRRLLDPSSSYLSKPGTSTGGLSLSDRVQSGTAGSGVGLGGARFLEPTINPLSSANQFGANVPLSRLGINGANGSGKHDGQGGANGVGSVFNNNQPGGGGRNGSGGSEYPINEHFTSSNVNGDSSSLFPQPNDPSSGDGSSARSHIITSHSSNILDGTDGMGEEITESITAQTIQQVHTSRTSTSYDTANINQVHTHQQSRETTATDQYTKIEQEEKKTFVVTGVVNPRNQKVVSMQQAIVLGIIDNNNGVYVNTVTKEKIPIPEAMNQGYIKVEFTTTQKSEEKRHDIGLITITIEKESRPYTVKAVIESSTDKHLSVDEAVAKGILDQKEGTYKNPDGSTMTLGEALDSGLLVVEFDTEAEVAKPEVITRTYAIHAVVDQKKRSKISFNEALKRKLIDKSTGAYHHNVDDEDIYVGDAIKKGFIKATVVKDPNSMDIDPENRMVINRVNTIRKKLLNPLKAMAAMKKAADNN